MNSGVLLIILIVLIISLTGCATSPEVKTRIWERGYISLPDSIIENSKCNSGLIRGLTGPCSKEPIPAVIFLHGCKGFSGNQFPHISLFTRLGYPVFSPSSLARPGLKPECRHIDNVLHLRREEISIALARLKDLGWIDMSRLVLAGFSQGGFAVASYSGNEFKAIIGMGLHCSGGRKFRAPKEVAVLQITGIHDEELPSTELCNRGDRLLFEAYHVDSWHAVSSDPKTAEYIKNFLVKIIN